MTILSMSKICVASRTFIRDTILDKIPGPTTNCIFSQRFEIVLNETIRIFGWKTKIWYSFARENGELCPEANREVIDRIGAQKINSRWTMWMNNKLLCSFVRHTSLKASRYCRCAIALPPSLHTLISPRRTNAFRSATHFRFQFRANDFSNGDDGDGNHVVDDDDAAIES